MYKSILKEVKPASKVLGGCIEVYDDVINVSNLIIDTANMMEGWRDAEIYSAENDNAHYVNKNYRSNTILDINYDEYTTHPLFSYTNLLVQHYLDAYCDKYSVGYDYIEPVQLLKYEIGEYYESHFDTGVRFPRVISALLYLNDVKGGGETYFENFDIEIRPKAGRLVIFPSNYAYTHAAKPPKKGEKYVLVYWTREKRAD